MDPVLLPRPTKGNKESVNKERLSKKESEGKRHSEAKADAVQLLRPTTGSTPPYTTPAVHGVGRLNQSSRAPIESRVCGVVLSRKG